MFTYIWRYTIRPECEAEFLAAYWPDGEWAALFARDPGYIRTELYSDAGIATIAWDRLVPCTARSITRWIRRAAQQ